MSLVRSSARKVFMRPVPAFAVTLFMYLLLDGSAAFAAGSPFCKGKVYDPVSDTNWNNAFPVTIGGVRVGGGTNPPLMHVDPICMCPGPNGVDVPGIGMTYWEPTYVAEIARQSGCLSTLGGEEALEGYPQRTSNQSPTQSDRGGTTVVNMEIHWYQYPLFSVLGMMSTLGCTNPGGFNLGDMTEVDPTWLDSAWSAVAFPETAAYASLPALMACIPDAVSSNAGLPLDMLNWCVGSQGGMYPVDGWSPTHTSPQGGNLHVLAKYMQRKTRFAGLLATIGPTAVCNSSYLPNMLRSQYRIDPIAPVPLNRRVNFGKAPLLWGVAPPANTPTRTDSAHLIWVGKQCCAL